MKRRLIIALAVALPLVIFGAAKNVVSWRPVVADIDAENVVFSPSPTPGWQTALTKTNVNSVCQSGAIDSIRLFSRSNPGFPYPNQFSEYVRMNTKFPHDSVGVMLDGTWKWHIELGAYEFMFGSQDFHYNDVPGELKHPTLFLSEGHSGPSTYSIPLPTLSEGEGSPDMISVSPADNHVDLVLSGRYFRWNKKSTELERNIVLPPVRPDQSSYVALSRDGETLVHSVDSDIRTISTRTGRILKTLPTHGSAIALSPFGNYAICRTASVIDIHNGRESWRFEMEIVESYLVFSSDEKLVAIPVVNRKQWEIRDLKTGELLRTLPLLPGVTNGQFSPDNSMLYSVTNGVLYRQRAR